MNKPIVAVDIDEVLMPHFESLIKWYNQEFGTSLTVYDNHPSDPGNWGTNNIEVAIKRVHMFYDTDEYQASKPFLEAKTVLNDLADKYELIVVTARDTIIEASTELWVEEHFRQIFSQIHFTNHFSLEGKKRQKADVLESLSVKYFIDDSLENITSAAEKGIHCLLFGEYAWNRGELSDPLITRCKDWAAVEAYFAGK